MRLTMLLSDRAVPVYSGPGGEEILVEDNSDVRRYPPVAEWEEGATARRLAANEFRKESRDYTRRQVTFSAPSSSEFCVFVCLCV